MKERNRQRKQHRNKSTSPRKKQVQIDSYADEKKQTHVSLNMDIIVLYIIDTHNYDNGMVHGGWMHRTKTEKQDQMDLERSLNVMIITITMTNVIKII